MYLEKSAIDYFRRYEFCLPVLSMQHGDNPSRVIGRNLEFEQYSRYYPGDNVRDIDWKIYARSDKLFIKNFGSDLNSRVRIIIDVSKSMDYGGKIEIAKQITAIFHYLLSAQKNKVFLSTVSNYYEDYGRIFSANLEDSLSSIRVQNSTNLSNITLEKNQVTFLISDLWDDNIDIHYLAKSRVNIIHLLTLDEMSLALNGNLELVDMEAGSRVNIIPSELRKIYRERMHRRIAEFRGAMVKSGLLYDVFQTDGSYYANLKDYLDSLKNIKPWGRR